METVTGIITKICDFLGSQDYAKLFDTIESALIKVVEWIASIA